MLAAVLCSCFKGSAKPVWGLTVLWWGMEAVIPQSMFLAKVVVCSLASFLETFLLTLFLSRHNPAKLLWFVCLWLFVLFCEVVVVS